MPDLVSRYLNQTRLGIGIAHPTLAATYRQSFAEITTMLGFEKETAPQLHICHSLSALPETLLNDGTRTVIYDQNLGQSFNRLTDFVVSDWPPNLVLRWGFKHLGITLAGLGKYMEASVALMLHKTWPDDGRPTARSNEMLSVRGPLVYMQEYFVLAHECVHAAIDRPDSPFDLRGFEGVIDQVVSLRKKRLDALDPSVAEADRSKFAEDELQAISSGSLNYAISSEDTEVLTSRVPELPSDVLGEWIAERQHLREELLCDAIATQLTVKRFAVEGLSVGYVLANLLHALHNLTSLEVVRQCGRKVAGAPDAQAIEISARKSFWRELTGILYGEEIRRVPGSDLLVEVTEAHAKSVGDQLIFTLSAEFSHGLERLAPQLSDLAASEDYVRQILDEMTSSADDLREVQS